MSLAFYFFGGKEHWCLGQQMNYIALLRNSEYFCLFQETIDKDYICCFEASVATRESFWVLEMVAYYGSDSRKNDY